MNFYKVSSDSVEGFIALFEAEEVSRTAKSSFILYSYIKIEKMGSSDKFQRVFVWSRFL